MCAHNTTLATGAPTLTAGTWVNISPAGPNFDSNADAFAQGITLDPCDSNTLYLAVNANSSPNPGLYKTTNAGASWKRIGPFDNPVNMAVDPNNSNHIYVTDGVRGNTTGFWVSYDGGNTFTMPNNFPSASGEQYGTDAYHVDADPTDFNHVLVSFHSSGVVVESFDGGANWTAHQLDPGAASNCGCDVFFLYNPTLKLGDAKTWLVGTQGTGYWRTTDAGTSWTKVATDSMEHGGGQIYYTKYGVLYVSSTNNVLRSKDNGATWQASPTPGIPTLSVTGDGTYLYSGAHGSGPFYYAKESDDFNWKQYNSQMFYEGPFELAYDSANGILYSSNIRHGAWALKVTP
jgi:photosystem II stability/assembly factor-like uncharacterized protein